MDMHKINGKCSVLYQLGKAYTSVHITIVATNNLLSCVLLLVITTAGASRRAARITRSPHCVICVI